MMPKKDPEFSFVVKAKNISPIKGGIWYLVLVMWFVACVVTAVDYVATSIFRVH